MEVNYVAILVLGGVSMVTGYVWFELLWGKTYRMALNIPEASVQTPEMRKKMLPLLLIQFALSLLQVYILSHFVSAWADASGIETSIWIWLGFVVPTLAGSAMWNNFSAKQRWTIFLITASYQFINFLIFGHVLKVWM